MGMPVAKKCLLCDNIELYFETIESYNIHIRDNHSDPNQPYLGDAWRCNICQKFFDTETEFADHIRDHHH